MSAQDNGLSSSKLPLRPGVRKTWPTIGARVPPEELHLVDAAASRVGLNRSEFIYATVLERTRELLGLPERQAA